MRDGGGGPEAEEQTIALDVEVSNLFSPSPSCSSSALAFLL